MCSLQHKCCDEKKNSSVSIPRLGIRYFLSESLRNTKRVRLQGLGLPREVRKRHKINTRTQFCYKREDAQSKSRTDPLSPHTP